MDTELALPPRQTSSRGRPSVIDREAIAAVALDLWEQHGLDNVSWADIAGASGVSARTLMRHFSSKEELAWVGVPAATYRLRAALDAADATTPTNDAIRCAILESLSAHPSFVPRWLHAITREPVILAAAAEAHRPWVDCLSEFLSVRHPQMLPAVRHAIASAWQVATLSALTSWAAQAPDIDPTAAVDPVLRQLQFVLPDAIGNHSAPISTEERS